jgi:hypothetical protein
MKRHQSNSPTSYQVFKAISETAANRKQKAGIMQALVDEVREENDTRYDDNQFRLAMNLARSQSDHVISSKFTTQHALASPVGKYL